MYTPTFMYNSCKINTTGWSYCDYNLPMLDCIIIFNCYATSLTLYEQDFRKKKENSTPEVQKGCTLRSNKYRNMCNISGPLVPFPTKKNLIIVCVMKIYLIIVTN